MSNETQSLELFIARFLRRGVLVAAFFIFLGWVFQISFTQNVFQDFHNYQDKPLQHTLTLLLQQKAWSLLVAYLGLIILISLPILRVCMTGFIFLKQKNYRMLSLVCLVFAGLILSLALGFIV